MNILHYSQAPTYSLTSLKSYSFMSNTQDSEYEILPEWRPYRLDNGQSVQLQLAQERIGDGRTGDKRYLLCDICGYPCIFPKNNSMHNVQRH